MAARRTIAREVLVKGVALHAGVSVSMRIMPAVARSNIRFRRSDLPDRPLITAEWRNIVDSRFATVIGSGSAKVGVTEHLLAALSGLAIDDCLIDLDGPEPPLLDGDALSFVRLLDQAGIRELEVKRDVIRVTKPVEVRSAFGGAKLLPSAAPNFYFEIDFPGSAIGQQSLECDLDEETFRDQIAPARTFGFLKDAEALRNSGFALGANFENTLVVDGDHLCNPEMQRFPDEFVRHKMLDAIGDMKLAGAPLIARFEGRRSSHALNAALLRALFSDSANYETV